MSAASNEKMKQTRASSSEQKQEEEEEEREGGLTFNPIWFWSAVSEYGGMGSIRIATME